MAALREEARLVWRYSECPCLCRRPARQRRPGPPGVTGLRVLGWEPGPGECPQSAALIHRASRRSGDGWEGAPEHREYLGLYSPVFVLDRARGSDAHGSSRCSSLSWPLHTRGAVSSCAPQPPPCAGGDARPARPRALHPAELPAGPPFSVMWGRRWLLSCCLTPALEDPVVSSLVS